ncbi:acetyltransferase [Neoasaia chiangmaiensis NBRC 101099]|uniref:Acetyltransferase n=1 Tax=Neoasaia chiangmaiensis TaxID=320497 RepID=A0A1U9KNH9_9PROT|nr:GNAT family N-acetyltransferase [Neoasaia chiangmaiensis]AQS87364.1 acetyltransferase [Neoasaia chiangmaiensis]GBR42979.1 acetyltransferase [Neoasaia chiangmaiensis NBRC 101099]GEN16125.1 acetyltransferase [Neoasaia chiangmaiensis]
MLIRPATDDDDDAIAGILMPIIAAGETYALPRDMTRAEALAYWRSPSHHVHVAEGPEGIVGTCYIRANQSGGGHHVANAAFAVRQGSKGVGRQLCAHALDIARQLGFSAMQFNFVVSTNTRAIALWQSFGFAIVGTLPGAFRHPAQGLVDAYVMFRAL